MKLVIEKLRHDTAKELEHGDMEAVRAGIEVEKAAVLGTLPAPAPEAGAEIKDSPAAAAGEKKMLKARGSKLLHKAMERRLYELKKDQETMGYAIVALERQLKEQEKREQHVVEEAGKLKHAVSAEEATNKRLVGELNQTKKHLKAVEDEKVQLAQLQGELKTLATKLNNVEKERDDAKRERDETRATLATSDSKKTALERRVGEIDKHLDVAIVGLIETLEKLQDAYESGDAHLIKEAGAQGKKRMIAEITPAIEKLEGLLVNEG